MTKRDEQFAAHPVFGLLDQLSQLLDEIEADLKGSDQLEDAPRLRRVCQHVKSRLDRADPSLVPLNVLTNLQNSLNSVIQELRNYQANRNNQHLTNASSHADGVLQHAASVVAVEGPDDVAGLRKDVSSFRRSASQLLRNLEDEIGQVREALQSLQQSEAQLRQEIDSQKGRLDSAISQSQQQISEVVGQAQQQSAEAVGRFQEQFSTAQERRNTEFDKLFSEGREKLQDLLQTREAELQELAESMEAQGEQQRERLEEGARSILAKIEALKDQAQQIVHTVGNIGMTGDYQRNAEEQRKAANRWRYAAIALFVLGVVAAAALLGVFAPDDLSLPATLRRIALAAVILTPAYYAAHQSRVHRQREVQYRSMELELASLDPFLALVPDDLKQAIKSELAARYFAGASAEAPQLDVETRLSLIQRLREAKRETSSSDEERAE